LTTAIVTYDASLHHLHVFSARGGIEFETATERTGIGCLGADANDERTVVRGVFSISLLALDSFPGRTGCSRCCAAAVHVDIILVIVVVVVVAFVRRRKVFLLEDERFRQERGNIRCLVLAFGASCCKPGENR